MNFTNLLTNNERAFALLLIAVTVFFSNLYLVFGLDTLINDDNARFLIYNRDSYQFDDPRSFIGLRLYLKWIAIYLMSEHSVESARMFMLIVYMIPISYMFYFINREIFGLSLWVSIGSAVLINTIPKQYMIPAFLDGSSVLPGVLAFLITIILSVKFIRSSSFSYLFFMLVIITWIVTCDLLLERSIFLFPALLLLAWTTSGTIKRKILLSSFTAAITLYRLYTYMQTAGMNPSNEVTVQSVETILSRISKSFDWWLPYNAGDLSLALSFIFITTILLWGGIKIIKAYPVNKTIIKAILFYSLWFVLASLPFWFVSKFFSVRYFYLPFMALTTIFLVCFQFLVSDRFYSPRFLSIPVVIVFILYGYQTYSLNDSKFSHLNKKQNTIIGLIGNEKLDNNTQLALVNIASFTGGFYMWSTGFLQHALKRGDITGIVGPEYNFYDPFNKKHCGYTHKMSCLDVTLKLLAYKRDSNYQIKKFNYFLQWLDKTHKNSSWVIYKSDDNNVLSLLSSGIGLEAYKDSLLQLNLNSRDVLWGDLDDSEALHSLI